MITHLGGHVADTARFAIEKLMDVADAILIFIQNNGCNIKTEVIFTITF
jgi:hypothetical protein